MSFTIWRWHMGECTKMCIALVSVGLLLGCAAPLQETQQIRCTDGDGEILYTGPYNEKSWDGYLVQVDESTRAFYPKGICRPEPAKEVKRSPEPAPAATESPDPVKEVKRSPEAAPAARKSPNPVKEVKRSPEAAPAASKSPGPLITLDGNPAIAKQASETSPQGMGLQAASWLATAPYGSVKVAYALVGGIVGGLTWVFTGGNTESAKAVWIPSMTGQYIVQPENLTGDKPLRFMGGSSDKSEP